MSIGVSQITSRIAQGYLAALKTLARVLAFSLVVAAISALITLPLWYWATTHSESFTTAVLVLLASILIFLIVKQLRLHVQKLKTKGFSSLQILLFPVKRIVKILLTLILLYFTLISFTTISTAAGIVSSMVSIILIGLLFFTSS